MKKEANARLREAVRKIMTEVMPDEDRVNTSVLSDQLRMLLKDEFFEISMEMLHQAQEKIIIEASQIINQHNLTDSPHGYLTPASLRKTIDDFDEGIDDVETMQQECALDLEEALTKFAERWGAYIAHIISPTAR